MSTKKAEQKSVESGAVTGKKAQGFSDEERAAMRERAQELKSAARADKDRGARESAVLAKIAEMPEPDRSMGARLHAIIKDNAPHLIPKLWYGMPAYTKDGKVVCFFQAAEKFHTRYATLGFNDTANLDEGVMWPTAFALTGLNPAEEEKIAALIKKAAS